jgi:hypothetical protein
MLDPGEASEPSEQHPPSRLHRFLHLWQDRQVQVVAGALAVVAAIAIVAPHLPGRGHTVTAGGFGGRPAASAKPSLTPRPVTSTTPNPRTPEQQAASVQVPAKLAAALRTWNDGPGGKTLNQVSTDVGSALQSGGLKIYTAMRSACDTVAASVKAAGTNPPIPDSTLQNQYSAALTLLAKAASDCLAAISEQPDGDEYVLTEENPTLLQQAQSEFNNGIKNVADVLIAIDAAMRPT